MQNAPSYYTSLIILAGQFFIVRTQEKPPRRILELASLVVPALDYVDDVTNASFDDHILKDRFGLFDPDTYRPLTSSEAINQVKEFASRLGISF